MPVLSELNILVLSNLNEENLNGTKGLLNREIQRIGWLLQSFNLLGAKSLKQLSY